MKNFRTQFYSPLSQFFRVIRKSIVKVTFFLILFSCQKENVLKLNEDSNFEVSIIDATKIAKKLNKIIYKQSKIGVLETETEKIKNKKTIFDSKDNKAIMHIINYEDDKGFLIISGDKRLMPFMAYSSKGQFDSDLSKEGLLNWTSFMTNVIREVKDRKEKQSQIAYKAWEFLDGAPANPSTGPSIDPNAPSYIEGISLAQYIAPILTTTWNQDSGYNFDCPAASNGPCEKAYTGCVATSMGQVMKRWQFPSSNQFNYTLMENSVSSTCNPNNNDLQVAYLLKYCGTKVNMSYSGTASSASVSSIPNALKSIGYSNSITYTHVLSSSNMDGNLSNGWPFILRGDSGSGAGHAWVCDGLARYVSTIFGYSSFGYYHMNWGWGGYCDGWYSFGSINPNSNGSNIGYNFNNNMGAVINIHP